jgi:hypothetical protein
MISLIVLNSKERDSLCDITLFTQTPFQGLSASTRFAHKSHKSQMSTRPHKPNKQKQVGSMNKFPLTF